MQNNPFLTSDNSQFPHSENSAINCTKLVLPTQNLQLIAQQNQIDQFVNASITDSTRKSYQSDLTHYLNSGGTIPGSPEMVAGYISDFSSQLSVFTLARRLVAISRAHTSQNLPTPTNSDLVKATLRGIRRVYGSGQRHVEPLVKSTLQELVRELKGVKGTRDKALLLIGFAGAFRRSELVSLQVEDIAFIEQGLLINLRRSKTDQEGVGRKIAIPYARGKVCPVVALKNWLEVSEIDSGPIFRAVSRHGLISQSQLSSKSVAILIKQHTEKAGLDPTKFSGHSLRVGLVTSAAQAGISNHKIRQQTGHRSDAMLNRYIRDANIFADNAAGIL